MTVLIAVFALLLTEAAFVILARKLHDRSIHQAVARTLARFDR
jgi:hypothetical protein